MYLRPEAPRSNPPAPLPYLWYRFLFARSLVPPVIEEEQVGLVLLVWLVGNPGVELARAFS